jgi:hypothetical protein
VSFSNDILIYGANAQLAMALLAWIEDTHLLLPNEKAVAGKCGGD